MPFKATILMSNPEAHDPRQSPMRTNLTAPHAVPTSGPAPSPLGPPTDWRPPPLEELEPGESTRIGRGFSDEEPLVLSVRVDSTRVAPPPAAPAASIRPHLVALGCLLAALGGWLSFMGDAPRAQTIAVMVTALAGGFHARRKSLVLGWAAIGLSAFWIGLAAAAHIASIILVG